MSCCVLLWLQQKSTTSITNIHNRWVFLFSSFFFLLLLTSTTTFSFTTMGQSFNIELPVSVPAGLPQSNTIKSILHILQVLCTFITVCVIASVISTEMKFYVCIFFFVRVRVCAKSIQPVVLTLFVYKGIQSIRAQLDTFCRVVKSRCSDWLGRVSMDLW